MNNRNEHLRRCVGCGEMKPKRDMIRVVKTAEGVFIPDLKGRANGRGAYICKNTECIDKASKSNGFNRSFKETVPKSLYNELRDLIHGR